jgi:hypothetical protein
MAAGVVDGCRLVTNLVFGGGGLRILHRFPGPVDLHLESARSFPTGAVLLVCDRPVRREAT